MRNPLFLLPLLALLAVAGCNTIKGVGRDVQKGGETITQGATEVQNEM